MQINVSVESTSEETTTESIVVGPEVEVCRVTVVRRSASKSRRTTKKGAAATTVTEHVRYTGKRTDYAGEPDPNFGQFSVVEPELIEKLRMTGWFHDTADYSLISEQPFTRVMSGKTFEVVRFRTYDHSLFAMDGQRLPVAVQFNYIDGRANDYSFDLQKLLTHLQARSDVTLHTERYSESLIQRVPHYNRGGMSGHHCLAFTWHPDVETFREFARLAAGKDSFSRYDAAHTLLGNDPFRIPERDDSDDDSEEYDADD